MAAPGYPPAEAFFLGSGARRRYCLLHAAHGQAHSALVYVHPFGDEMNRARHVAAHMARTLAAHGTAVLLIDLHGCGDSAGDFAEARWDSWKEDLDAACTLLAERSGMWPGLIGLRLGALLALDYARTAARPPARLILWQPVLNGAAFVTQFLRLRSTREMLARQADAQGTDALRARLSAEGQLEVAGYMLAAPLAQAIDALDAATLAPAHADWFEVAAAPDRPLAPASQRVAERWRAAGCALRTHSVAGPAFWATPELADGAALVQATAALMQESGHGL